MMTEREQNNLSLLVGYLIGILWFAKERASPQERAAIDARLKEVYPLIDEVFYKRKNEPEKASPNVVVNESIPEEPGIDRWTEKP